LSSHVRVHAAGIISNHAPERAMVVRGRIGPEDKTVLLGLAAKVVENAAGLDPPEFSFRIDLQNAAHVFGHVDHNSNIAALPRKARSTASIQHRRFMPIANGYGVYHVFFITRNYNSNRHLPIIRSVG